MLTLLAATPNWWDMPGYSCLRQVRMDKSKDIDLDVLQAAINLSHRDKFLRDQASRRVAMKRLYQHHPVSTLYHEGVSKCSDMMGATFILFLILYRICSKRSQAQATRIKIRNRAAIVRAVKADQAVIYCPISSSHHKAGHRLMIRLSAAITVSNCKGNQSAKVTTTGLHVCRGSRGIIPYSVFEVKGQAYHMAVIRQLLLMSGDVELNPGPLDSEY